MQLAADQALRKELLLFAITKQPDLKAAMEMAAKMERFVLEGRIAPPQEAVPSGVSAGDATSADQPAPSSAPAPAVPGPYGSGGTKRRWSEADDAALKELWHSAVPLEEIAESMDRTTPSLYCRARALGFSKRTQPSKAAPQPALPDGNPEDRVNGQRHAGATIADAAGVQGQSCVPGAGGRGGEINEVMLDRYRSSRALDRRRPGPPRSVKDGWGIAGRTGLSAGKSAVPSGDKGGIDTIVQFLRSRDYSIVRVSEGRFRLDGRHVLSVDELRDKANQVRKSLGQPPFVSLEEPETVNW